MRIEIRGRRGQRLRQRIVVHQLAETPLARPDPRGHRLQVLQRRLERLRRGRVVDQPAERAAPLADVARDLLRPRSRTRSLPRTARRR